MKRIFCLALCLVLLCGCATEENPYIPTGNALDSSDIPQATAPQDTDAAYDAALAYDPGDTLNPYSCMSSTNRVLFSLLYQGLFTVSRNYTVSPILCKSYNLSADMKTYTFYIEQAYFSDGAPLTAADVAASLNAARESRWYGNRLQHILSVTAYGDAVVVELSTPMENLPLLLDIPIVKASQVDDPAPTGSGPYRYDGGQLKRQAAWWCDAQLAISGDTIGLYNAESDAQLRDLFDFSKITLTRTDPSSIHFVQYHSDYELWECENGLFLYLACNSESKVFSNDAVRAALTHAIDRDWLVATYYQGFARSAQLPCSPQSPFYNTTLASNYGYVEGYLQAVLEREGLAGSEIKLLLNADDPTRVKVGEAIAQMLERCGLIVTIQESTGENFSADLKNNKKKGAYDLYLAQTRLSPNMDLSAFFGTDTPLNYGGLSSPGIYAVSLEALANRGNYYTLYEMIMDDGLLCPLLFQSDAIYGQRGQVSSLQPARDNLFYYNLGKTMDDVRIDA